MAKGLTIVVQAPLGGSSYTAYLDGDEDQDIRYGSTFWIPGATPYRDTHPSTDRGVEVINERAILTWGECSGPGDVGIYVGTQEDGLRVQPGEDLNFSVRLLLPAPLLLPRTVPALFGCE